jgi:hypothetical protein
MKFLLTLAFALLSINVAYADCSPAREYAQYKDEAARPENREGLGVLYCTYTKIAIGNQQAIFGLIKLGIAGGAQMRNYERDRDSCNAEAQKISDALFAVVPEEKAVKKAEKKGATKGATKDAQKDAEADAGHTTRPELKVMHECREKNMEQLRAMSPQQGLQK